MSHESLAYEKTFDCVQCGYCLPACPTYLTMGKETHSPRGRIHLVKMAAEGKIPLSDLEEPIELCLGCRACERVCPTNVQYGDILDSAKHVLQQEKKKTMPNRVKMLQNFMYQKAMPKERVLNSMGTGLAVYQKSGLQKVVQKSGLMNVFPEHLSAFENILPAVEGPMKKRNRQKDYPAANKPVYKVGFFKGCIMDTMFSSINTLSMKLLQAAGCKVTMIDEQTCCGAIQHHSGETETTKELARRNIEAFEQYDFDYIVNSIGGCGAMLIEYDHLFAGDPDWKDRARAFAEKNVEISVLLNELELPLQKEIPKAVTYQPSCHMTNVQKRVHEPLQLLKQIPGIHYIEMPEKDLCCGSAGIYNLVHYDESMDILDKKMKHATMVKPEVIVTTNPGCHLQMKLGIERENAGDQMEVVHLVELLAEACNISDE
ncbi:(Fe-S)-binding protein [Salinibacillus aidingensis]|uniref:Glycolate oxidase iron-sulfur subunit n=1 Tax=Salinibacillus aidingensis TaxID=237684 RepID=A0ABN1AWE1_9BACI